MISLLANLDAARRHYCDVISDNSDGRVLTSPVDQVLCLSVAMHDLGWRTMTGAESCCCVGLARI